MRERTEDVLHATFIGMLAEVVAITLFIGMLAVWALIATRLPEVPV